MQESKSSHESPKGLGKNQNPQNGKIYGRLSSPLMKYGAKTPEKSTRRHSESNLSILQLGIPRKRRTLVRSSASLVSDVPNKKAKLDQPMSHNSDTELESNDCRSEDRDPLAITPSKEVISMSRNDVDVTSTRDNNIALLLSEPLVKDLLSTPTNPRISFGSDGEYDTKCEIIKKDLFGGSPPPDFRVPRVVRSNSSQKATKVQEKSPSSLTISRNGSFAYDSDMDMLSDSGKQSFESTNFQFEPIETINEYPNLNRSIGNNEVITGILESCVVDVNKQNQLKCIVDKSVNIEEVKINQYSRSNKRSYVPKKPRKSVGSQRKNTRKYSQRSSSDDAKTVSTRKSSNTVPQRRSLRIQSVELNNSRKSESAVENIDEIHSINGTKTRTRSDSINSDSTLVLYNQNNDSDDSLSETDPNYIDIEAMVADNVINDEMIEKMGMLRVKREADVAPQHLLEYSITLPPPAHIKRAFVDYAPLKRGPFNAEEERIVKKNWRRFCKIHKWNPAVTAPFLQMRYHGKMLMPNLEDRLNFVRYLAKGLPSRSLYSILLRFRTIFRIHDISQRRYTALEDEKILSYLDDGSSSDRCRKLSLVFKRSKKSIYKRLVILKQRAAEKADELESRVKWNIKLAEEFLRNLMELTLTKDIADLKDEFIPKVVWVELEKRLKITHSSLNLFWYNQLHLQLYCPWPIYENDLKIMLIEYLYVKGITLRDELNWAEVARHFDGVSYQYLCRLFCRMVAMSPFAKFANARDIGDMIEWMYKFKIPDIIDSSTDRYLPHLQYNNGKLEIMNNSGFAYEN